MAEAQRHRVVIVGGGFGRVVVLTRWAFSFLTHGRGTRLITGDPLLPEIHEPKPPVIAAAEGELSDTA